MGALLRRLLALFGLLALAGPVAAQVALTSTTLTAAIPSATAQQITVASTTGISVNNTLFIDREALQVLAISGNVLTVARGQSPVVATAHAVSSTVLAGTGSQFYYYDPSAGTPCVAASTAVTPWVNLSNGNQWTCTGSLWTLTVAASGVTSFNTRTGVITLTAADIAGSLPFCNGYTPTTGQVVEYTTGSTPNPCYTAITVAAGGVTPTASAWASIGTCSTTPFLKLLNNSYYNFALCDGSSNLTYFMDGKQAYPPAAASNWTVVNSNSGVAAKADSKGAVTLSTTASVLGMETLIKAIPATPYTKTIAFRAVAAVSSTGTSNFNACGVVLTNGTASTSAWQGYEIEFNSTAINSYSVNQYGSLAASHAANYTTTGTIDKYFGITYFNPTATIWVQIADDGTTRTGSFSVDGVNYVLLYSAASSSPITPTEYGVMCRPQTAGAGVPWLVTVLSDN